MTTTDDIATLTRAIALKTQVLAHRAPATATHIVAQLDETHDGYPAGTNGPGSGFSNTSSTERAVMLRDDVNDDGAPRRLAELYDWLCTLNIALTNALKVCDTHGPRLPERDLRNLRCQGLDWEHPCPETNIADPTRKDRRCIPCGRTVDAQRDRTRRRSGAA